MTHERDVEHILDLWLASGPRRAPDQVVDDVVERIARQPQRAAWRPAVSDRLAPIATGMVGRAAALTVVAAVGLIAVAVVFGPVGKGPAAVPSPVATVSPRTFQAEVDRLVDPPDTIQVTVLDETGMVVRVIPHPASRDDVTTFFGPGGAVPSILVVNPHADVSLSRAIVLWLADPMCDERVTMTLARDGDGLRVVASVVSSRRDVPDASDPGPSQSGLDGAACGATYPLGVELDLSEPFSADRFTASLTRVLPARGLPDVPVDPTLEAVSRTNPSAEAKEAMRLCVREGDLDKVAGMAQLPARDVHRFTLTNGNEPELQTDALVWAIQFKGAFFSRRGGEIIDPLCVVIDLTRDGGFVAGASSVGTPLMFAPYGLVGETFTPPKDFVPASAALPPLAP